MTQKPNTAELLEEVANLLKQVVDKLNQIKLSEVPPPNYQVIIETRPSNEKHI